MNFSKTDNNKVKTLNEKKFKKRGKKSKNETLKNVRKKYALDKKSLKNSL